ncbi:MAG: flagellar motor protein MotB [Planctomycetota bacterium]|jgi:chemotaxis protein MotB
MKNGKGQKESDEAPGAPEWMVTFSDCMTLLLTFFVLLLSFSTFEDKTFTNLKVIYSTYLPSVGLETRATNEAVSGIQFIRIESEPDQGSEKPTDKRKESGGLRLTQPLDFYNYKVFVIPSSEVFWGNGTAISVSGRETLSMMAEFLKGNPLRVVIGETDLDKENRPLDFGLSRAYAIINYLVSQKGLNRGRFNVSAASTINKTQLTSREIGNSSGPDNRFLEIVLLEWSIYN